jgi:iron complex outermembrane recepter protein
LNRLVNFSTPFGQTYQDARDGTEVEWDAIRLEFNISFANMDLTSLTSYDETYMLEQNRQELTGFSPAREGDWEVWQQEFRVASTTAGSVQWIAGLYFTGSESTEDTWVSNTAAAGGMGVRPGIDINSEYDAWSAYGQMDWNVSDAFSITAGLRYTDDKLSAANDNWRRVVCGFHPNAGGLIDQNRDFREAGCPGGVILAGTPTYDSPVQELSEIGWKLGVNYQVGEKSILFASISEGFKGGSYDNRALSTGDDPIGPEFLTAFEIGFKGSFANDTVHLNGSWYFYDWEGMQLFESYGGVPALVNVPGVEIRGVEVELKWAPNERWYLQGSVGTAKSEVSDITGLDSRSQAEIGKKVSNTPDVTANVMGSYTIPMGNNSLALSLNYRYVSSMFYTFDQSNARDESSAYSFLNARASLMFGENQKYNLALWANNLTEEFSCARVIWGPSTGSNNYSCFVSAYGEVLYGMTFEASFGGN